jgi:AbrB family looped-hinge helix DNA binding protein
MDVTVLSAKGQIVLPKAIREALRLRQGDPVQMNIEGDRLVLTPVAPRSAREWQQWRGCLKGTGALDDLVKEHGEEVEREHLS